MKIEFITSVAGARVLGWTMGYSEELTTDA